MSALEVETLQAEYRLRKTGQTLLALENISFQHLQPYVPFLAAALKMPGKNLTPFFVFRSGWVSLR